MQAGGARSGAPGPAPRSRRQTPVLLARFRLGLCGIALGLSHLQESLALAGVLSLAGVVRTLAGGLALTGVDTLTLHLAVVGGAGGGDGGHRENHRGGGGESNAGHLSRLHPNFSLER